MFDGEVSARLLIAPFGEGAGMGGKGEAERSHQDQRSYQLHISSLWFFGEALRTTSAVAVLIFPFVLGVS